jgi:hypothetical protein
MGDYITRLYDEYIDLNFKINKLKDFLDDNKHIEEFKISLMRSQVDAMQQYKAILLERIKLEEKDCEDVY